MLEGMEEEEEEGAEPDCLPFVSLSVRERVCLMPSYIGDIGSAIFRHLNRRILQFSSKLGGVLVSYSKPSLLRHYGMIMADLPQIHIEIQYTATVLQTPLYSTILATVDRIGEDFITCSWAKCINILIPLDAGMEESLILSEGDTVLVTIMRLSEEKNEYVLHGRLVSTGHKDAAGPGKDRDTLQLVDNEEEQVLPKEKKKKRKRKYSKLSNEVEESDKDRDTDNTHSHKQDNALSPKKKKKRKEKQLSEGTLPEKKMNLSIKRIQKCKN